MYIIADAIIDADVLDMAITIYSQEGQVTKRNILGNRGVLKGCSGRVREACSSVFSGKFTVKKGLNMNGSFDLYAKRCEMFSTEGIKNNKMNSFGGLQT